MLPWACPSARGERQGWSPVRGGCARGWMWTGWFLVQDFGYPEPEFGPVGALQLEDQLLHAEEGEGGKRERGTER